jgi:aminoglycoside phosphotransferase (APT) family kinase protein
LASVERHNQLPQTLGHGDVHLKNWYIAGSGAMGLSDWQCAHRGHWGRDFAYTISTALTVENRRAWDRELLQFYLDRMQAAGGPKIDFNEAWGHYRQQLLSALTWWTVTLTPPEGMPDMQPRDITLEFIRRITTAMDDVDALDSLQYGRMG